MTPRERIHALIGRVRRDEAEFGPDPELRAGIADTLQQTVNRWDDATCERVVNSWLDEVKAS